MFGHWFVVASQKTVKIFTEVPSRNRLKEVKNFDNPLGRERVSGLAHKEAGRGVKSVGLGVVRYSERKRRNPHEEAAIQFAREVSQFLASELQKKKYESLTVVAEPHFIGKLKAAMSPEVRTLVEEWKKKNLLKLSDKELSSIILPPSRMKSEASLSAL